MARDTGELQGRVLNGQYRLEELLSDGTSGKAYRAIELVTNREVRIKLLPRELQGSPGYPERFKETTAKLTRLDHPNIVPVIDSGISEEGPFVVSELIEAETLRSFLKTQGPTNESLLAQLGLQICTAIHTAHSTGLLHGDLSPETILILGSPQMPELQIVDFGLAGLLAAEDSSGAVSSSGQIIGKPEYLSPEQIRGDTVTERSDIYSLGILLYEMITGSPPFTLKGKGAEEMMDLLMRQTQEPAPALEDLTPPVYISEKLRVLLFQMLEKEPIARVSSPAAVSSVLRNLGESEEGTELKTPEAGSPWVDETTYAEEDTPPIFADEPAFLDEYPKFDSAPPAPGYEAEEPAIDPLWQELASSSADTEEKSFDDILPDDAAIDSAWQDYQEDGEDQAISSEQWTPPAAEAFKPGAAPDGENTVAPWRNWIKRPTKKQSMIIGGVIFVLLLLLFSGGDDEHEQTADPATQELLQDSNEMHASSPTNNGRAAESVEEQYEPLQNQRERADEEPHTQPPTKVGIVDLGVVILRSHAGKQLADGYQELYQKAKSSPNAQEKLEKLTEVNSRVVSQLLVDLREVVRFVGQRENYAIILSEEGEIATAPFIHERVEDPVGVLTTNRERTNLNAEVLVEFNKIYENPDS